MKKILLATTFLVATTGFAAAEISFGGSAAMGIARDGGTAASTDAAEFIAADAAVAAAQIAFDAFPSNSNLEDLLDASADRAALDGTAQGDFETYSSAELAVTFSGDTDNGLTFGADFAVTVGRSYTLGDGDGFANEGGFDPMPHIWIDGAYGKLTIADDDFDFFDDTNAGGDLMYEATFGAIAVGLIADIDASEFSAKAAYTAGNLAASFNVDTYELWNVEASYTFNVITATIATDESSNSSVKVAYASGPITASLQYNTDTDAATNDSFDVATGFVNNGMTLNAEYNTDSKEYEVTTSFDLGGGLSLEAGANQTGDVMIGAAMTF